MEIFELIKDTNYDTLFIQEDLKSNKLLIFLDDGARGEYFVFSAPDEFIKTMEEYIEGLKKRVMAQIVKGN